MGKERQKQAGYGEADNMAQTKENEREKENVKMNEDLKDYPGEELKDDSSRDNHENKEEIQDDTQDTIKKDAEDSKVELEKLKSELDAKTKQCSEYLDRLQRTAAEFDNYKKRTAKEKESIYVDALVDIVGAFLPVLDNIERALKAMPSDGSAQSLKDGVEMVFRQFKDVFKKLGVEDIKAEGEEFDPSLHNAVMHVEDETVGNNIIVEEFQKGYKYKDKVIRYSMVKVAN